MKKVSFPFLILIVVFLIAGGSCRQKGNAPGNAGSNIPLDSALVAPFFNSYPLLQKYEKDLLVIYRNYDFQHIWFDEKGIVEFGNSLYSKVKDLEDEGISATFPYPAVIDAIFNADKANRLGNADADLMLTSLYLFYVEKVYKGLDSKTTASIGWLLPRKKVSYASLLDSIIADPNMLNDEQRILFGQYYKLRDVLKLYRGIEEKGGWDSIELDPDLKAYKPNDSAMAIRQIRERLFISGDLTRDNKSSLYDPELVAAVKKYKARNGFLPDSLIKPELILSMNVPVSERIKIIVINMERCRWISPEIFNSTEYIFVNIPAYKMVLIREGKPEFGSPVVVGESMTQTVIFAGKLSYIVFSPYWNVPESIIESEVKPGMEKNKNYLDAHHMEWNNGQVRQKPGKNNSLGLVKFMFPNSNNIYLHDTPSKSLFKKENRALSHGCVRVARAKDLAYTLLEDDETWTTQKIDKAMNAGKESNYTLKRKIPVYIGYFTAWIGESGELNFYKDIYERDERLAKLLIYKD